MISNRLKVLITTLGITKKEFAESVGLSGGGLSDIISGRNQGISKPVLKAIEYAYKVNINWLLTGEGEMFLPSQNQTKSNSSIVISGGKNIQIGNQNSIHNYPISDDEQEIIDSLRKTKNKEKLKIIRDILKLGGVLFVVLWVWMGRG